MALFSKEPCAFCGKEVGMMSRSKMSSKDYVCDDCRKKGNPFARVDHLTKDQVAEMFTRAERDEKLLDGVELSDEYLDAGMGKVIHFRSQKDGGDIFTVSTPETQRYEHRPVFYFSSIRKWNPGEAFVERSVGAAPREAVRDYSALITLKEKLSADKKNDGWELRIPYFDTAVPEILIKIPKEAEADKVQRFYRNICGMCEYRVSRGIRAARDKEELQVKNACKTANEALKAALKGGDVKEVLAEGLQKSIDIDQGKVKKKGFFARLFGR